MNFWQFDVFGMYKTGYTQKCQISYMWFIAWKPKGQNYFKGFRNPAAIRIKLLNIIWVKIKFCIVCEIGIYFVEKWQCFYWLISGIVGTHRFCSARDLGDQCQDLSYPDHDRLYRACVYSCTSDDCNSAPFRAPSILLSLVGLLLMKLFR